MKRKILAACLFCVLALPSARADVFSGTTAAAGEALLLGECSGVLEEMCVQAGQEVTQGEIIGSVRTGKVFATQNGTVAAIHARQGEQADGIVLEIMPEALYQIYCTVEEACASPESMLVHSGEEVYLRCTADGTHLATGIVTQIDGSEYRVVATGGELYIGETVHIYRDSAFSAEEKIGIGTVVSGDTESYPSQQTVVRMHVAEGDYVERGQLLYETLETDAQELAAPADGIVTQLYVQQGGAISEDCAILAIVPRENICVQIVTQDESAAALQEGERVLLLLACDPDTPLGGTVSSVRLSDGQYTVCITPDDTDGLRLGMSVQVLTGEDV